MNAVSYCETTLAQYYWLVPPNSHKKTAAFKYCRMRHSLLAAGRTMNNGA
jgi:hypothetical protein